LQMPEVPPSIKHVAARAGVSVATVSRVLNDSAAVVPKTRDLVRQVVAELGYEPNHLARNLRSASSGLMLVTVPNLHNPFYGRVVEGITRALQEHGYHMLLCETSRDALTDPTHLRLIQRKQVDGAICLDPATVHRAIADRVHDLPWVALCEYNPDMAVPYVGIDNERAARDAVQHLVSRGHQRIAILGYDPSFMFARQRFTGYTQALEEVGVSLNPALQITAPALDFEDGAAGLHALWDRPAAQRPTAIFAVSDTLAIGVLRQARELGISVPKDLAVVGFDDIDFAAQTDPGLTTIRQPMSEMGYQAGQLLIQRVRGKSTSVVNLVLRHELQIRGSS
jgi:LacI family transcriptional regulator, repressor for deo operon, udp, cdd, tsx, nupC, and nupG